MYKPKGYITGRDDPDGRPSVHDLLRETWCRVEPVGRLDFDTEGALLLTNDGELAHQLTHPSMKVPKRYLAKVYRTPDPEKLTQIEEGRGLPRRRPRPPAKVRVVESTDKEQLLGRDHRHRGPQPADPPPVRPAAPPGVQAAARELRDDLDPRHGARADPPAHRRRGPPPPRDLHGTRPQFAGNTLKRGFAKAKTSTRSPKAAAAERGKRPGGRSL
jgi:pseudouridine synthase